MLRDMQRTLRLYEVMARSMFYWRLRARIIARMEGDRDAGKLGGWCMIASLIAKLSQSWSSEYQIAVALVSGVTLGLLIAVCGRAI